MLDRLCMNRASICVYDNQLLAIPVSRGKFVLLLLFSHSVVSDSLWPHGLQPKITADGDYSHEIKRCLLLGRKVMTNLGSILQSRDITLPAKVLIKAMIFPVVMYGCESWTVRKAELWNLTRLNCGVGEDSWESLGQQGDPTSPS